MVCERCGSRVPDDAFCTRCGAHRGRAEKGHRIHRFALAPHEHVVQPAVFSTLFPHMGHGGAHRLRLFAAGGVAVVVALYAAGFLGLAVVVAALMVPALYLHHLQRASLLGAEPARAMIVALGGGVLVGGGLTEIANRLGGDVIVGPQASLATIAAVAVAVAVLAEALKPLPALTLRRRFPETMDGLIFGVAAGLGYGLGETAVNFAPILLESPLRTSTTGEIDALISVALLVPLLQAGCSGAWTASLWRLSVGRGTRLERMALPVAILAHISFLLGSGSLASAGAEPLLILAWQVLVVSCILVFVRLLAHGAALEEAGDLGLSPRVCGHCHRSGPAGAFCPHCGQAVVPTRLHSRAEVG